MTTNDAALAARAKRLRNGGQTDQYQHDEFGVNSRLDEMQAAILRARLPLLADGPSAGARWRADTARRSRGVDTVVVPPELDAGHVYHLFPVRSRRARRDAGASASGRHRDADSLPDSDPAASRRSPPSGPRIARSPTASAARSFRCRSTPSLADVVRASPTRRRGRIAQLVRTEPRATPADADIVACLRCVIAAAQFGIFEVGLRTWGSSEAAPSFQGLFETDAAIGYRLKPHARTRFTTSEFTAEIAINGAGVRDDEEIGPKQPDERRIVLLGDSLVLSVQVPFAQTFGELLEQRLNQPAIHRCAIA